MGAICHMGDKKAVNLGEKIEIVTGFNSDNERVYFSMIQDIISEHIFLITLPMSEGESAFLHLGEEIRVCYFRPHGQYWFQAKVIDRYKQDNIYSFKIQKISEVTRLQRRNYFRLQKTIPVKVDIFSLNDKETINTLYGYTLDIGGGGLAIVLDSSISRNTKVKCTFTLDSSSNIGTIQTKGKVIRSNPSQNMEDKFEVGICFEDISDQLRDEIIKFIFEEQRRLRKKGLI